jgi:hypothetical protein
MYIFFQIAITKPKNIFSSNLKKGKKNRKEKPQLSTLLVSLLVKRFIGSPSSVSNSEGCNSDGLHLVLTVFFVVLHMAMSFVCKIVLDPKQPSTNLDPGKSMRVK